MKKVPTATCALMDRNIVSIERVKTPSTFYVKSSLSKSAQRFVFLQLFSN